MLQPVEETARRGKDIDIAQASTVHLVVLFAVLLREGYVNVAADVLHVEGSKPMGDLFVLEGISVKVDLVEVGVIYVHTSFAEIGYI